jgi:hypothetical protein
MSPAIDGIEEAVRAWMADTGHHVDQIVLNRRGKPVLLLPVTAAPAAEGRANVPLEVLKVLRDVQKPLTGLLVLDELTRRGVQVSKRTLDGHLADMVADGTLANPPGSKPPGYRLPE